MACKVAARQPSLRLEDHFLHMFNSCVVVHVIVPCAVLTSLLNGMQTVFFPLVPGVDTVLEPVVETAEDLQQYMSVQMDQLQHSTDDARQQLETYQQVC